MDLISRQDAIDALEREKTYSTAYKDGYTQTDYFKQYNMGLTDGIKALNKLPSVQPDVPDTNVGDMVSRTAVIEIFSQLWDCVGEIADKEEWQDVCKTTANELPSAQPEIIRCRDCIAYQEGIDIDGKPFTRCNGINGSVRTYGHTLPDWYCADAERRTDE